MSSLIYIGPVVLKKVFKMPSMYYYHYFAYISSCRKGMQGLDSAQMKSVQISYATTAREPASLRLYSHNWSYHSTSTRSQCIYIVFRVGRLLTKQHMTCKTSPIELKIRPTMYKIEKISLKWYLNNSLLNSISLL